MGGNVLRLGLRQTITHSQIQAVTESIENQTTPAQPEESACLIKEVGTLPFIESYCASNLDRMRFYTGLIGFDVLKIALGFLSPNIT